MKKIVSMIITGMLIFNTCFCVLAAESTKGKTVRGEFAKVTENWMDITTKQKLEDFDYLYQTLIENYPYVTTVKRMTGIDMEQKYKQIREKIEKGTTDAQFYLLVDEFTNYNNIGHLDTFNSMWYAETAQDYQSIVEAGNGGERLEKIAQAYNNTKSIENYKKMNVFLEPIFDEIMSDSKSQEPQEDTQEQTHENVTTKIIEEGKTAYIKIDSFPSEDVYETDKKILFDFYEKVKDYENVIFDFTQNGGGAMSYFDDLIVAPNIDRQLSATAYIFAKNGAYNKHFMSDIDEFMPVSQLPKLPRMNQEDLKELDVFSEVYYAINPMSKEKALKGKLWMLVSENVFSSSEYGAMFSKASGFATLVGTQTGGDGIGSDPLPIVLKNSGLVVRYSPIYGATPDGTSSQEFGTTPDIVIKDGQNALEVCLEEIASKK